MSKQLEFCHLHVHTEFSLLDGKARVPEYVAQAKAGGMDRLAIMDHGVVCGAPSFYRECRDNGIEPILAEEFYFTPKFEKYDGLKSGLAAKKRFHVGMIAIDADGFRVLCEWSTAAHSQYHFKPMLDRALIEGASPKDRAKLYVLSGCAGSIISQKLLGNLPNGQKVSPEEGRHEAEKEAKWWIKMFPNFAFELMHHKTEFDRRLNAELVLLAKKFGKPWVITNDPHYVVKEDACHHDALLAISTGSDLDDPERFRFEGEGYWLKTPKEMAKTFKSYEKGIWLPGMKESVKIADQCHVRIPEWESRTWHIPKFPFVDDSQAELERLTWKGIKKRRLLGLEDPSKNLTWEDYEARLKHELAEFKKIGMADFLLITHDTVKWAKKRMRVGPGRGSVAGTLVGFAIGIHKIDSLYYDLSFERFLNPDRPKMPDVDMDYSKAGRDQVLDYYPSRYGAENTMPVAAFGTMQAKAAFKALTKAHGMSFQEANRWSKRIMEDEEGNVVWPQEVIDKYPELIDQIRAIFGLKSSLSSHPAGMVVFDPGDPVRNYCPEMWIPPRQDKPGRWVMQYNLASVDDIGLLKQDNLALRTLDTIEECVQLVKERRGIDVEPDDWWPGHEKDDDKIFRMLAKGETSGIFQLEGRANTQGITKIKPREFEDLVACTSLYRAGPMEAGAPGRFLTNRRDKKVRVAHKALKKLLTVSWGEMIYDEQMFDILHEAAGFSWARVDDAKTAMKKKKPELMEAIRKDAIRGFQKTSGMDKETATQVWRMIAAQASYLFNRSHAVSYSHLSYQTARLKYLYPLEYFAALLRTVDPKSEGDKDKRERYMKDAIKMGFSIEPPDVNLSDGSFMPAGADRLLFGLKDVKGVGPAIMRAFNEHFQKHRKRSKKGKVKPVFKTVEDVYAVVKNQGAVDALAACGALRSIGIEHDSKKQEEILNWRFEDRMIPYRQKYEKKFVPPKRNNGPVVLFGELMKATKKKTKRQKDYMTWVIQWAPGHEYVITLWSDVDELWDTPIGSVVRVKGKWNADFRNVSVGDPDQVRVIYRAEAPEPTKKAA